MTDKDSKAYEVAMTIKFAVEKWQDGFYNLVSGFVVWSEVFDILLWLKIQEPLSRFSIVSQDHHRYAQQTL